MPKMADVFLNAISVQMDDEGNIVGFINVERMREQLEALLTDCNGCVKFHAKKRKESGLKGQTHLQPMAHQWVVKPKRQLQYSQSPTHSTNTPLNGHYKQSPDDERF